MEQEILKMFQTYLTIRQQFTIIEGVHTNKLTTRIVLQVLILGPLLFTLYMIQLPQLNTTDFVCR